MNSISAVIIDDEFFNRKLISMLIAKINPLFEITGEAENVRDGFKVINELKPDIVFLDIKMPDGSGFDLLNLFTKIDFEVVFISGFDQYALQAFDFNALDYVLKPIDGDKFKITLDKVHARIASNENNSQGLKEVAQLYHPNSPIITKIPIHYNDRVVLLNINEIMYIQSIEGATIFSKSGSEKYTSSKHLSNFEFILNNFPNYIKVNKSAYANLNFIADYSRGFNTYITMMDQTRIEISAAKKIEIIDLLSVKRAGHAKN